jgi:hypothetical protein
MREVTKAERERIETVLKKMKLKLYQAEIGFVSHDHERLRDTARSLTFCARKLYRGLLAKRKTIKRKKTGKRLAK